MMLFNLNSDGNINVLRLVVAQCTHTIFLLSSRGFWVVSVRCSSDVEHTANKQWKAGITPHRAKDVQPTVQHKGQLMHACTHTHKHTASSLIDEIDFGCSEVLPCQLMYTGAD